MDQADDDGGPGERGETNAMRAHVIADAADAGPVGVALAAVATGGIALWAKVRRKKS